MRSAASPETEQAVAARLATAINEAHLVSSWALHPGCSPRTRNRSDGPVFLTSRDARCPCPSNLRCPVACIANEESKQNSHRLLTIKKGR